MGNYWPSVGDQKSDLEAIDKDCRGETEKCLTEMLTWWLRQGSSPTTWSTLISVLKHPTVGFKQLADEIECKKLNTLKPNTSYVSVITVSVEQESENGNQLYNCGCKNVQERLRLGVLTHFPLMILSLKLVKSRTLVKMKKKY